MLLGLGIDFAYDPDEILQGESTPLFTVNDVHP